MPKKPAKLRPDVAEVAFRVFQEAIGKAPKTLPPSERKAEDKNPAAVKRGKEGGKKGGTARAAKLTHEEREAAAQLAAEARWKRGN